MAILKTLTINGKKFQIMPVVPAASVTLLASAWQGDNGVYSQVVNLDGVTATTKVDLQFTDEQVIIFKDKNVTFTTANDGGVVTVKAIGDKLTNDYTIQVTVTEVEGDGTVIRGNVVTTPTPRPNLNQTDPTKPDYIIGVNELGAAFEAMGQALEQITDNMVSPEAKTGDMTQAVGMDENGKLWTVPGAAEIETDTTFSIPGAAADAAAVGAALAGAEQVLGVINEALEAHGQQIQANTEAVAKAKMPEVTAEDNGKFLRVTDGAWAAVSIEAAEGASF